VGALTSVHLSTHNFFGILDRYLSSTLGQQNHGCGYRHEERNHEELHQESPITAQELAEFIHDSVGQSVNNADKNQQRYPVSDSRYRDWGLLQDPLA